MLDSLIRGVKNPKMILNWFNESVNMWSDPHDYNIHGTDIFEEDWDNLIILDACRYDAFESQALFDGKLEYRISKGSTSSEFIRGNFKSKTLGDTVYVSANDWFGMLHESINTSIHKYISVHDEVDRNGPSELVALPNLVSQKARTANRRYPNKRLIIHYMQPHQPFIGDKGVDIDHELSLIESINKNDLTHQEVVNAYEQNLSLVLDEVSDLINDLEGKTVITADHGELLGERSLPIPIKFYGHPKSTYKPELVKVPWFTCEYTDRKKIIESGTESPDIDIAEIEDHLKDLGYRTE